MDTSAHIFRKLGFAERVRRSYWDHRFDGQAVFASIAEHGDPILMDRLLAGIYSETQKDHALANESSRW